MQNTFNIVIESVEYEVTINNLGDVNEWIKALDPAIESYCENIYYSAYGQADDVSESFKKELSNAYTEAVSDYMRYKDVGEDVSWEDTWNDKLTDIIEPNELFWEWGDFLDEVRDEILDTLENSGVDNDSYPDLDVLHETLGYEIEGKILSKDDSTVFDYIGHVKIPLMHSPGKILTTSIDDLDVYMGEELLSNGDMSFLRLTGASVSDYIKAMGIILDDGNIASWLQAARESEKFPSYVNKKGERLGINCSKEKMTEIVENAGTDGLSPCWVGRVSIDDLRDNDPSLRFAVKGGFFGLVNFSGGSGYVEELEYSDSVVIEADGHLEAEGYYSTESIFGFYSSAMEAEIISSKDVIEVIPDKKRNKKREFQLNLIP